MTLLSSLTPYGVENGEAILLGLSSVVIYVKPAMVQVLDI